MSGESSPCYQGRMGDGNLAERDTADELWKNHRKHQLVNLILGFFSLSWCRVAREGVQGAAGGTLERPRVLSGPLAYDTASYSLRL